MRSKKAVYNISTNLVLQLVILIYGLIVPKIIITLFGSEVNGLTSSIVQFLNYITLLESGFGPVVKSVLYKPIANKDKKSITNILKASEKFFHIIATIFIFYILFLIVFYPMIINSNFDKSFTISLIVIISISIFAEYFFGMTYRLFLQADQKNYVSSTIQIITYILSLAAVIILSKTNCSIQLLKLITGLIFVLRPVLQNIYVKKKYSINLKEADSNYKLERKWDGLAQHIAGVIHQSTDVTILTIFSNLIQVSIYNVYYLVIKGIKQIIQSFSNGIDSSFGDMIAKGEQENLNKKFDMYEVAYFTIISIAYNCTLVLIVPFVTVYTKNITDANYIVPLFATLLVISEFVWAIRLPYSSITLAAGKFKETRIGAWLEAVINIGVSICLVKRYGLVGVAIGTLTAMIFRTIEFIIVSNKLILKRSNLINVKKILLIVIDTAIIYALFNNISLANNVTYLNWIYKAILVFFVTSLVVVVTNLIFYKKQFMMLINILKNNFKKKKGKKI